MQNKPLRVLIACEESQTICKAFRARGFEAYSCDIQECSGGHPEWHIQGDAIQEAYSGKYTLMIAHPSCTYLSYAGSRHWHAEGRAQKRADAMAFFMQLYNAPVPHIAIENPRGEPITHVKESQTIHPYYFGDEARKRTMLWLKNLPLLYHNAAPNLFDAQVTHVGIGEIIYDKKGKGRAAWLQNSYGKNASKTRSKTFDGIAQAMAEQWGNYLQNL
jgi:hypothetical protein